MLFRLPRPVAHKEFALAALERAGSQHPLFDDYWGNSILPIICSDTKQRVLIGNFQPPRYVLSFMPWRVGGIPGVRVVYKFPDDIREPILIEAVVLL